VLKITHIGMRDDITLKLEGKLAGPWVDEMEKAWCFCKQTAADQQLIVDLNEVTFIDVAGALLLRRMHAAGATFRAEGPYISHELQRIKSNKPLS
jgi:ABC-type transporter Mla MlaB component